MATLLAIVALALSISFLCSILEAVFLSITHAHIAVLKGHGEWAGAWLDDAQKQVDEPIAAILTLNTIAHTVGATLAGAQAAVVFGDAAVGIFSGALTIAVLIVTEVIPKTVGAVYWRALTVPTAHVLRWMIAGMKPLLLPLGWMSRMITPKREGPTVSRTELEVLAEIGRRDGALDEDEFSVVTKLIRLDEVSIDEVMTPRTDIAAVPAGATLAEVQALMLGTGHFRLPVYEDSLDKILGVVLARDVLWADRAGETELSHVTRAISFAPASKPVEDLIPEMRSQRAKMAIVVDEFGGTAGLVTLEDLLEEIIGEVQDEHEEDEPVAFRELDNGRLRLWGGHVTAGRRAPPGLRPGRERWLRYCGRICPRSLESNSVSGGRGRGGLRPAAGDPDESAPNQVPAIRTVECASTSRLTDVRWSLPGQGHLVDVRPPHRGPSSS